MKLYRTLRILTGIPIQYFTAGFFHLVAPWPLKSGLLDDSFILMNCIPKGHKLSSKITTILDSWNVLCFFVNMTYLTEQK